MFGYSSNSRALSEIGASGRPWLVIAAFVPFLVCHTGCGANNDSSKDVTEDGSNSSIDAGPGGRDTDVDSVDTPPVPWCDIDENGSWMPCERGADCPSQAYTCEGEPGCCASRACDNFAAQGVTRIGQSCEFTQPTGDCEFGARPDYSSMNECCSANPDVCQAETARKQCVRERDCGLHETCTDGECVYTRCTESRTDWYYSSWQERCLAFRVRPPTCHTGYGRGYGSDEACCDANDVDCSAQ